jgi:Ca2+-transporting ATPase
MVIFLFLAGIVTLIQQEWLEGAVIFPVVVLNSSIGYWPPPHRSRPRWPQARLQRPMCLKAIPNLRRQLLKA